MDSLRCIEIFEKNDNINTNTHTQKKQIVVDDTAAGCSTRNQHHTDGWNKHKQTLRDVNFTISKSFIKKNNNNQDCDLHNQNWFHFYLNFDRQKHAPSISDGKLN